MRYPVKRFVSLATCLKELQPFILNGEHLQTGKPFRSLELRSREVLANWLLCVATNSYAGADRLVFTSDPLGGDGIIIDQLTGETWPTEHVIVPRTEVAHDLERLILDAVGKKIAKGGKPYASGKTLVVFLNAGGGTWMPNRVAKALPNDLAFDAVWVVGLQRVEEDGSYEYAVSRLDLRQGNAPTWSVKVPPNFGGWTVSAIQ